ncbi:MAG: ABC transporter permease subunit [Gordonia sp. (in: high G+C Gram-positive bacteria)]|uniref:ABC transporter permease n=1 Tax=Gordonia sp. (in: high G+C Gram-positive bacteria) TaxID=84139 RepID=UPI003C791F90
MHGLERHGEPVHAPAPGRPVPTFAAAVTTIAGLEIRQRIRSTRWKRTLAALFVLVSALVLGSLWLAVIAGATYAEWSRYLYELSLGLVLFLGLAAAPTMSATSINGDRRDATLAPVQATPISSMELTVGKWLGSWAAALTLIAVAAPYLVWGTFTGAVSVLAALGGVVVTALLLGCYCALGLGFSALTARPAASAMLTQATVLLLLIGLPIGFGMTLPLLTSQHALPQARYTWTDSGRTCADVVAPTSSLHTERTWWLLAPNPLLIVTDNVAAGVDREPDETGPGPSVLLSLAQSGARSGPFPGGSACADTWRSRQLAEQAHAARYIGHTWYLGLLVNLAIGGLGLAIASRRLRVPARRLPKGVRVA